MDGTIVRHIEWGSYYEWDNISLLLAIKFRKRKTFPIKTNSSYYQGVATSPSVGMELFSLFEKPDARSTLDDWNVQKC